MKRLLVAAAIVVAFAGLVAALSRVALSVEEADPEPSLPLISRTAMDHVVARGELRSSERATIGAPSVRNVWNFTVTSLAPEGAEVGAGVPLVSFDVRQLSERLDVLSSELDTARKELEKTTLQQQEKRDALLIEQVELQAKERLLSQQIDVPEDVIQPLELKKLRLDHELATRELELTGRRIATHGRNMTRRIDAAAGRVEILETETGRLRENIQRMTVRAPRPGFVVHAPDWGGNKVKVGESIWYGRPVIELADLSKMEVLAEVAEPDAQLVRVGQRVEIRLDAAPDKLFSGTIEKLGRLFHPRSNEDPTMVFDAVVSIDEANPALMRPGMAAVLKVLIGSSTDEATPAASLEGGSGA